MRWDDDDDAAQLMFVDAGMPGQKLFIFGFRTGIRTGVGMAVYGIRISSRETLSLVAPLATEIRYCDWSSETLGLSALLCCGRLPSLASELFETKTDKALIRAQRGELCA